MTENALARAPENGPNVLVELLLEAFREQKAHIKLNRNDRTPWQRFEEGIKRLIEK